MSADWNGRIQKVERNLLEAWSGITILKVFAECMEIGYGRSMDF
jgi:hypothetical protein